jgi:hypothetical protein
MNRIRLSAIGLSVLGGLLCAVLYLGANSDIHASVLAHPQRPSIGEASGWRANARATPIEREYSDVDEVRDVKVSNLLFTAEAQEGRQAGGDPIRMAGSIRVRRTKLGTATLAALVTLVVVGLSALALPRGRDGRR